MQRFTIHPAVFRITVERTWSIWMGMLIFCGGETTLMTVSDWPGPRRNCLVKQPGEWSANLFFETLGIKDDSKDPNGTPNGNPYPSGKAYTSGVQGVPGNALNLVPGDRVFMVELSGA